MSTRLAALCLLLFLPVACGEPVAFVPEPGVSGKPVPELGTVAAAIVDRPATDRAVVEAEWTLEADAQGCEVVLQLPEGALLVAGEPVTAVAEGQRSGRIRWTVEFPSGAALDVVIRLCGTTAAGFRIAEAYARLTDG